MPAQYWLAAAFLLIADADKNADVCTARLGLGSRSPVQSVLLGKYRESLSQIPHFETLSSRATVSTAETQIPDRLQASQPVVRLPTRDLSLASETQQSNLEWLTCRNPMALANKQIRLA